MQILFIHQNFPGQFGRLASHLADDPNNTVVTLGERKEGKRFPHAKVHDYWYPKPKGGGPQTHGYIRGLEADTRRGQSVYRAMRTLKGKGYSPDVVYGHPGWGDTLFVKDVFPDAKLICFWEFFYSNEGSDRNFDPEFPSTEDGMLRTRMLNSTQLLAFESSDWGITPTMWQKSQFPSFMQETMSQVFDGIDTDIVRPNPDAVVQISDGPKLARDDEVLTYIARNLEPYRGFHTFMRSLPSILERRPNCQVLIVGEDGVSYGKRLPEGETYKQMYQDEVGFESDRIHFLGRLSYSNYLSVLQVSSVHLYLTYPFVLSWSCVEAMGVGCAVIGSATPPVQELLIDDENGLLVEDMLDPQGVADKVVETLERRNDLDEIRQAARQAIVENYDFKTVCLPQQIELIRRLTG